MGSEQAAKKQRANRAHYEKTADRHEAALLRLDIGDLARLDRARATAGLSRSAFAKFYLLPFADSLAAKFGEIERARSSRNVSLSTFLDRAIAAALDQAAPDPSGARGAASEFDELFGQSRPERGD